MLEWYWWLVVIAIFVLCCIAIFSYLTNPFVRFSVVKDLFPAVIGDGDDVLLVTSGQHRLRRSRFARQAAQAKSGWHIVANTVSRPRKASSSLLEDIIADIHALRFNPLRPFLISGDHFSVFYPRSLGIFYHAALDPRVYLSTKDWLDRQTIYLKSTAFALEVFSQAEHLSTTIVPMGRRSVALMNIYAPPSDTLYSLLYALRAMEDPSYIAERYPFIQASTNHPQATLQTSTAAGQLLSTYRDSLIRHWRDFHQQVYDDATGLVKKSLLLSGVKDMAKRESAFYDNVMYWKTLQLAQELQLVPKDTKGLAQLKERILGHFWDATSGHFLEDLSAAAIEKKYYSSEWIVAYQTGFLDPRNEIDLPYLLQSVRYIQQEKLDRPFALRYHTDERPQQLYWLVRWFASSYGSTTIWSNLGQEYTKLLIQLYQVTKKQAYLIEAKLQLDAYSELMVRDQGYPELYDQHGRFFRQGLYKSIRQTGWVISFEQARAMYQATR